VKEIVVVSGKGGTGKTSVVACFAALAEEAVLADCDVDASDLPLVLEPEVRERHAFSGGKRASIAAEWCNACGECVRLCRFGAVVQEGAVFRIDALSCEGCGVCADNCPADAVLFEDAENGEWFVSQTRFGPMVHARLGIAAENSGKLVTLVRKKAREIAADGHPWLIVDGPPGIGCPVIASIGGADLVLIVSEPTPSGLHDARRAADLARHFRIPVFLCVNRFDLNLEMTERLEHFAREVGAGTVDRIPYDPSVTAAQIERKSVVEFGDGPAARAIRAVWRTTREALGEAMNRIEREQEHESGRKL
jgi:MinD superfamily P-loop ATPase